MLEEPLLNHLIRPLQERQGDRQAAGLRRLQVDEELEFRRLFDGEVAGFRALEITAYRGRREELLAEGFAELVEKPLDPIALCGGGAATRAA